MGIFSASLIIVPAEKLIFQEELNLPRVLMSRPRLEESCDEKPSYPFALVLRLRVVQVVSGILTLIMGVVALIEEKTPFNMGLGLPAGISTVLAAANNIYSSRGFDGYEESSCKWMRFRFLGATLKLAAINLVLWGLAIGLLVTLAVKSIQILAPGGATSITINVIAMTEIILCLCVVFTVLAASWVDGNYDPDCQELPDLAHSNTGTAVSMVTLSQSAPV